LKVPANLKLFVIGTGWSACTMACSAVLEMALKSEDMPDDILPMVWLGIKSIHQNTTNMKEDIHKLELRTTALEASHISHDDDITEPQRTVAALKVQILPRLNHFFFNMGKKMFNP
jgi:hypothetical protein